MHWTAIKQELVPLWSTTTRRVACAGQAETRNKFKIQNLECSKRIKAICCFGHLNFEHSILFRISCFGFRIFNFFIIRSRASLELSLPTPLHALDHGSCEQRKHDLMMTDQRKPFSPFESGPGHHIGHRAIVSNEIHIQGRKLLHVVSQVPDAGTRPSGKPRAGSRQSPG